MATLLDTSDLRENIETDLIDAALQRLNEAAELLVIQRGGPLSSDTKTYIINSSDYPDGRDKFITLSRPPGSISSISEQIFSSDPVILDATDYDIIGSNLERLNDGTNPRSCWGHKVIIIYVPEDNEAIRKGVIIDLVKAAVAYQGVSEEKAGDFSMKAPAFRAEREAILSRLNPSFRFA